VEIAVELLCDHVSSALDRIERAERAAAERPGGERGQVEAVRMGPDLSQRTGSLAFFMSNDAQQVRARSMPRGGNPAFTTFVPLLSRNSTAGMKSRSLLTRTARS
jgi:hypothetical protein